MEIAVEGIRVSPRHWQNVRKLPKAALPRLTDAQKTVAQKMGISEEDYARSAMAGEETQQNLLAKTEKFARLLEERIKAHDARAKVSRVALITIEHRFEVVAVVNGAKLSLRIDESLVDDLFESGSAEAEKSLDRVIEMGIGQRVA